MSRKEDRENFVVNKICKQVRKYHCGHTPLILIDTLEIELANRIAGNCNVIALRPNESTFPKEKAYYDFLDSDEKKLDICSNFSRSRETLTKLYESTHKKLDHCTEPQLVLLQLRYADTASGTQLDLALTNELMNYVYSYVNTYDDFSPIRSSCVLLFGKSSLLPESLIPYTQIISVDYPGFDEIKHTIITFSQKANINFTNQKSIDDLARKMRGFTLMQTEFYVKMMLSGFDSEGREIIFNFKERNKIISQAKEQSFKRFGKLKLYEAKLESDDNTLQTIGGMGMFLDWAKKVKATIDDGEFSARRGIDDYKGALLAGVPGCGKSKAAFALYEYLNIPMLKCDFGSLMGKYVGESEQNLRDVLKICENISPCILWMDEIDKSLSGTGSAEDDSGPAGRMLGHLLVWLQENKSSCLVIATANDIGGFPFELTRKGRFDILYAVHMPTHREIKEIFKIHMKNKPLNDHPENGCFTDDALEEIMSVIVGMNKELNTDNLPDATIQKLVKNKQIKFLSGADIEDIVVNALRNIDDEKLKKPLSRTEWINALKKTINDPLMETQGSSEANLDLIAACYVRLIRKGFVPVSKDPLFVKENYVVKQAENNLKEACYEGNCPGKKIYDRALFEAIKERFNSLASSIENEEHKKISRC